MFQRGRDQPPTRNMFYSFGSRYDIGPSARKSPCSMTMKSQFVSCHSCLLYITLGLHLLNHHVTLIIIHQHKESAQSRRSSSPLVALHRARAARCLGFPIGASGPCDAVYPLENKHIHTSSNICL